MKYIQYSYDKLASKLYSFVMRNQPVRVIVCFSSLDSGRDREMLILLKQFGVAPFETYSQYGGFDADLLSKISSFEGLTILLESIPVSDAAVKSFLSRDSGNTKATSIPLSRSTRAELRKLPVNIDLQYLEFTSCQSEKLSAAIQQNQELSKNGYIYLSGFSVRIPAIGSGMMLETGFLPWYLEVANQPGSRRVIRQPDLNSFIQQLTETGPVIHKLDQVVQEMASRELELDI